MRIAVMGSGGIGGYFGGRIAQSGKHDVWFIARGAHLAAMQETGLTIRSAGGDSLIEDVQATGDPAEIGPVDIVIFAVKLYDVDTAAAACRPLLKDGTGVVSLQNGVGTEERIDEILGAGHAVGGIAYAPLAIESPGVIRHHGDFARLTFGEMSGADSGRVQAFRQACEDGGVEAAASTQIRRELWDKFAFLSSFAGITCLTRQPCRILQEDEAAFDLFMAGIAEAVAVARAEGVELDPAIQERLGKLVRSMSPEAQSSMLTDLQTGKPLENAWFSGRLAELGRRHGVPTPVNDAYRVAMRPFESGPPA